MFLLMIDFILLKSQEIYPDKSAVVLAACQLLDRCNPNPCEHRGKCKQSSTDFTCDCTGTGYSGAVCHTCKRNWGLHSIEIWIAFKWAFFPGMSPDLGEVQGGGLKGHLSPLLLGANNSRFGNVERDSLEVAHRMEAASFRRRLVWNEAIDEVNFLFFSCKLWTPFRVALSATKTEEPRKRKSSSTWMGPAVSLHSLSPASSSVSGISDFGARRNWRWLISLTFVLHTSFERRRGKNGLRSNILRLSLRF